MANIQQSNAVDVDTFYKSRIDNFQIERDIFNNYISTITPNKGELHVLDWEYRSGIESAASAVAEREKITSDLKKVTREIMNKKSELNALRNQQEYRIAQIQRLSELSQPVQRDTTYVFKDRYASRANINMYSGVTITDGHIDIDAVSVSSDETRTNTGETDHGSNHGSNHGSGSGRRFAKSPKKSAATGSRNIIKSLRTGEVMMLEARLEEETRILNTSIEELDMALKEVKIGTKALDKVVMKSLDSCRSEAAELIKEVDKLDHQGYLSVSELLNLRLKIMIAQREEVEELSQLRSDKEFFSARETQMREQLISDMSLMKRRLKAEATNSTKDFHSQSIQLDASLIKLHKKLDFLQTEKIKQAKTGTDDATEKLKELVLKAEGRFNRLRSRWNLESEGYRAETNQLRKKLASLEAEYEKRKNTLNTI
jgi:hypothetical protein